MKMDLWEWEGGMAEGSKSNHMNNAKTKKNLISSILGEWDDAECGVGLLFVKGFIAVATTEADEAITSSDFLKIMGIFPLKGASRGDSGQFWSLRLVWF